MNTPKEINVEELDVELNDLSSKLTKTTLLSLESIRDKFNNTTPPVKPIINPYATCSSLLYQVEQLKIVVLNLVEEQYRILCDQDILNKQLKAIRVQLHNAFPNPNTYPALNALLEREREQKKIVVEKDELVKIAPTVVKRKS